MKKEDIIKKAWLEFNLEPEKTDENGFVDFYALPEDFPHYNSCFQFVHGSIDLVPRPSVLRPRSLIGIEFYNRFNNPWIKIQDELPPFGKRVIFRAEISWRSDRKNQYFDDELTNSEESLEYGIKSYLLKDKTDFIVCQHKDIKELYDEYVTHWMEIQDI